MKKIFLIAGAAGTALLNISVAQAATQFDWNYVHTATGVSASGVAQVNSADLLTFISGTVTVTSPTPSTFAIGPMIAGGPAPLRNGFFEYDNVGPLDMTVYGWLALAPGGNEVNIWSNVGASVAYAPITNASLYENNPVNGYVFSIADDGGTLSFSNVVSVPEPATWAMMLLGLFGLGALLRTSRRTESGELRTA